MYRLKTTGYFILILAAILLQNNDLKAQKTLRGCYSESKGLGAFEWNSWRFYEDGRFYYQKESDFGFYAGAGDFRITRDSLLISFDSIPPDSRHQQVVYDSNYTGSTTIRVHDVLDPHYQPMFQVALYAGDSLIEQGASDSTGHYVLNPSSPADRLVVTAFTPEFRDLGINYGRAELEIAESSPSAIHVYLVLARSGVQFVEGGTELRYLIKFRKDHFILHNASPDFIHPGSGTVRYQRIDN